MISHSCHGMKPCYSDTAWLHVASEHMLQNDLVVCVFVLSSDSIFRQQSICRNAPGGRSWQADSIKLPCRYAREDALGKLGGAVAEGAQLIEDLYQAFYQELQKPLASAQAGPNQPVKDSTHGQSSQGAYESPQNEAAAKVTSQQTGTALCVVGTISHSVSFQAWAVSHNRPALKPWAMSQNRPVTLFMNIAVHNKKQHVTHYPVTHTAHTHRMYSIVCTVGPSRSPNT